MTERHPDRVCLSVEQGVLLWCMRVWVAGSPTPLAARTRIRDLLAKFGATDAAPHIDAFMTALRDGASRPIDVAGVAHPVTHNDERALLDVLGLAQGVGRFEAMLVLRGFLNAAGARAAFASAEQIGMALARAGCVLPAPTPEMRHLAFPPGPTGGAPLAQHTGTREFAVARHSHCG